MAKMLGLGMVPAVWGAALRGLPCPVLFALSRPVGPEPAAVSRSGKVRVCSATATVGWVAMTNALWLYDMKTHGRRKVA